jgi:hypothetical protein
MTKTDEFIKKVEQLNPHLTVDKYHNLYGRDHSKVDMIIWYRKDINTVMSFASITYLHGTPVVETSHNSLDKDYLALYSDVINLCVEYFPYFFRE